MGDEKAMDKCVHSRDGLFQSNVTETEREKMKAMVGRVNLFFIPIQQVQLLITDGIQAPDKAQIQKNVIMHSFLDGSVRRGISKKEQQLLNTFKNKARN